MAKTIEQIYEEALREIKSASNIESIKTLSIRYLGRKGVITHFLRNISNLPLEKRADVGKRANDVKKSLDKAFNQALKALETKSLQKDYKIDVSLPGRAIQQGFLHPITQITWQICKILEKIGFD
ncbi:MAG: phenylalanine--tRNA ligase subunit alpha, partial [Desulfobacteraceae bacterium]|nr:phenylalanine--tRNA ligase subunit alpha [Pseudomonadota bacterium]MCG2757213.1 phenylalanine--tRNA ligase subunit alpha [Desulfobacteraceae bacterium]